MVANMACMHCYELMKDPVTLFPCGHSYCKGCTSGYLEECEECHQASNYYSNTHLQEIIGKFSFVELTVSSLKRPAGKDGEVMT